MFLKIDTLRVCGCYNFETISTTAIFISSVKKIGVTLIKMDREEM